MRYIKSPTERIFYDAYAIADAICYQQDQESRMKLATEREGILSNKATGLSNDIVRLSVLIRRRIEAWDADFGTHTNLKWHQHLSDYRHVEKVLVKVEQWEG
jgi:hypothetical protein